MGGLNDTMGKVISMPERRYECIRCGRMRNIWSPDCFFCGSKNSVREIVDKFSLDNTNKRPVPIERVVATSVTRVKSGVAGLDFVHCGLEENSPGSCNGIPKNSCTIIGGDPSIGKSTLLLQLAMFGDHKKVLCFTGEESNEQVADRARRLAGGSIPRNKLHVCADTNLEMMITNIESEKPDLIIVDSVQKVFSTRVSGSAGGTAQIRHLCSKLIKPCKSLGISLYLVGQVTKAGTIAGPKALEHEVDVINFLSGDVKQTPRMITCLKNRFGEAGRSAVLVMGGKGFTTYETHGPLVFDGSASGEKKGKK
jgi:DNA repair protein RadA/Sms